MQYKGLSATFHYIGDIGLFVGEIFCSHDTISFSAPTLKQLEDTMKAAVDNYLGIQEETVAMADYSV